MFSFTMNDIMTVAPLIVKMMRILVEERAKGKASVYDPFKKWMSNCYRGVPLGTLGAGSIGRSYRGYFQHFQLFPGIYEQKPILANQFSAFVSRPGGKSYSTVLSAPPAEVLKGIDKASIGSWDWNLKEKNCSYHGLFPRSWTVYDGEPDPEIKITCRQISPFIPRNYKESSFPVAVFTFTVQNSGSTPADVTLLFTWANSVGGKSELTGNHSNSTMRARDGVHGVLLRHSTADGHPPVTFAIASQDTGDVRVTCCPSFSMGPSSKSGEPTAKEMWEEIKKHGSFGDAAAGTGRPSRPGSSVGAAVAAATTVTAGCTREVSFALSWSCPVVKFPAGRTYHRRHTKFVGLDRDAAAEQLAHHALLEHMEWERQIEAWQRPVLQDKSLPDWYPVALFNELYYLNAGGTIWTDGMPSKKTSLVSSSSGTMEPFSLAAFHPDPNATSSSTAADDILLAMARAEEHLLPAAEDEKGVGKFLYLEGMEYHMYNTYDVHFYASFALLSLFPDLELSLQRDFAAAVLRHDPRLMYTLDGKFVPRKVLGAVPHDIGLNDPWHELNAYMIHDPSRWKDLNPKFVLQVYRDVAATGDLDFARSAWPSVYVALAYMDQFDRDRDGMVENEGRPDQTYDLWSVSGVSAYTGGLWVAALRAATAMAALVGDLPAEAVFLERYNRANKVYDSELWTGDYFRYDNSGGGNSESVMADQLAGQWYVRACGLEPVVGRDKARRALAAVLEHNVMQVQGGGVGAVNGARLPEHGGGVDESSTQSKEVWTGTTYAVAAAMIGEGMREEGFTAAKGAYGAGWGEDGYGYAFQMPESWTADGAGGYRSLHYMRPLAVWAMQWALSPPTPVLPELEKMAAKSKATEEEVELAKEKFEKVASLLRLPEEEKKKEKGYLRAFYQILRQILLPAAY